MCGREGQDLEVMETEERDKEKEVFFEMYTQEKCVHTDTHTHTHENA